MNDLKIHKSMTLAQIADILGVTSDTLRRWIRNEIPDLDHRPRYLYKPKEVKIILENFV